MTARKREERLVAVPIAVSAFGGEALRNEAIDGVARLLPFTPSATFAIVGPAFTQEVMIRGVGNGRTFNVESAIGQYRNGAYVAGGNMGGRTFGRMDFFDVERVEVLRGPQGALYGRNAAGGAINILSVLPQPETSGSADLSYGSYGRFEGEGIANARLSDTLFLRAGLLLNHQEGGVFRDARGRALDEETQIGARAALRYRPTDQLDATLMLEHFDERGPSFAVFAYDQLAGAEKRFVRQFNSPSVFKRNETSVNLNLDADFGAARLTSVSYFKRREATTDDDIRSWTAQTSPLFANWRRQSSDSFRRFGQELRLSSDTDGRVTWLVGGEVLLLNDEFRVTLDGATGPARRANSITLTHSDDRSIALFGLLGIAITEKLLLTGELRSTWDRKTFEVESTIFSPAGVPTLRHFTFDRTFPKVSPVATLAWKPTADSQIYLRYASGFRGGGFNNEPDPQSPERYSIAYGPETTKSVEIGSKLLLLDRRLLLAATAYTMRVEGLFINSSFPFTAAGATREINVIQNGGRSRQQGIELETSGRVVEGGQGFGTLDVRATASRGWGEIEEGPFAGLAVPRQRTWQASASATWRHPLARDTSLFVNYSFRGEWGGLGGTSGDAVLDNLHFHDAQIGVEAKRWRLVLAVENLADDLFDGDRNIRDAATGLYRQAYTTLPRSFSLRGRIQF